MSAGNVLRIHDPRRRAWRVGRNGSRYFGWRGTTKGWQARCYQPGTSRYQSRFFADHKWGGSRKAKSLALAWLQGRTS